MLPPLIRGGDDDSRSEWSLTRSSEKRINIRLLQGMGRIIELALDGTKAARVALLRYKIDANVWLITTIRPLAPKPNVAEFILIEGICNEVGSEKSFKLVAKIPIRRCRFPELFQNRVDGCRHVLVLCSLFIASFFVPLLQQGKLLSDLGLHPWP